MSRISPFHFTITEYDEQELQNMCPRYIKWLKKVRAFDFSKRKKGKVERTLPSYDYSYRVADNSRNPKKSRGFLSKIRRGGQNLRVRCRTSADLWRRWIRGGIMYNTELNEMDEQELEKVENEEKVENKSKVEIKIEPQSSEEPKDQEVRPKQSTEESSISDVKNDTEKDVKNNATKVNERSDANNNQNQILIETKVQIERINDNSEEKKENVENQTEVKSEPKDVEESQTKSQSEPQRKQSKPEESVTISMSNGINNTSSAHHSRDGMPEVVANE